MASGENVLWIVGATNARGYMNYIFRTREAAYKFIEKRRGKRKTIYYSPLRATWGPEQ